MEVHRFGITGYGKGKERVLEQGRAIMLGAKVRAASASHPQTGCSKGGRPGQGRAGAKAKSEMMLGVLSHFSLPKIVM